MTHAMAGFDLGVDLSHDGTRELTLSVAVSKNIREEVKT